VTALKTEFTEFLVLPDRDTGVVAVITTRDRHDKTEFSFSIQKEFERDGRTERSTWLLKRHCDAVRRLIDQVEERLEIEEDKDRAGRRIQKRHAGVGASEG
jgi:hypothetical protein